MVSPLSRVAALLSTYNGEAFVAEQLDSLRGQEGVSLEVFARDDGSTDATLAILARYADQWPQLAAPMSGPNLGPAMSFLTLLAAAPEGFDYYAFCDQDDVWMPDKLARAADKLAAATAGRPGLYCSPVLCVDEALRPIGERAIAGEPSFEHLLYENIAFGATMVIDAAARSAIAARPPQSGVIMHDWWCALWAAAFGVIVHDDRLSLLYRQHRANAIGATPSRLGQLAAHLKSLSADPSRFYPIRAQAEAFRRLHGEALSPAHRRSLDALVDSNRSTWARLRLALSPRVVRGDPFRGLAARALIALGLY
jgi:glycosyltransferase involved in cell wall biosynthesis